MFTVKIDGELKQVTAEEFLKIQEQMAIKRQEEVEDSVKNEPPLPDFKKFLQAFVDGTSTAKNAKDMIDVVLKSAESVGVTAS